jgi:hypothetical protein
VEMAARRRRTVWARRYGVRQGAQARACLVVCARERRRMNSTSRSWSDSGRTSVSSSPPSSPPAICHPPPVNARSAPRNTPGVFRPTARERQPARAMRPRRRSATVSLRRAATRHLARLHPTRPCRSIRHTIPSLISMHAMACRGVECNKITSNEDKFTSFMLCPRRHWHRLVTWISHGQNRSAACQCDRCPPII